MEEGKSSANGATSTANQVNEKESSALAVNLGAVVLEKPSDEGSVQANDAGTTFNVANKAEGSLQPQDAVTTHPVQVSKQMRKNRRRKHRRGINDSQENVEKAPNSNMGNKAEGSLQSKDAGTTHHVQISKQMRKNKRRKLKRGIHDSQKNVEGAPNLNVGNKGEGVSKDNQNSVEKASSSNVVNTVKGVETTHPGQVTSRNKRKRFWKDKKEREDGKKINENLPTAGKGKKQEDITNDKRGDGNKKVKRPRKELNGDASKKDNMHQNAFGRDSERKDKGPRDQHGGDVRRKDWSPHDEVGGVIFMCNARTKPDCFRYSVFGVSRNKKELVLSIKPGIKLFLYDFDLKLMYGVYKASSEGGMKLEPAAFGGAYPAQVRFVVEKECVPLPEGVFKKAIKESYDERTHKFQNELTLKQANRLAQLFSPAHLPHSNGKLSLQELSPMQTVRLPHAVNSTYVVHEGARGTLVPLQYERQHQLLEHYAPSQDVLARHPVSRHEVLPDRSLFLTEKEYRSYGLQQGRSPVRTAPIVDYSSRSGREKEQLQRHPDPIYVDGYRLQQGGSLVRAAPVVDYSSRSGREREQLQRHPDPVHVDGYSLQQARSPVRTVPVVDYSSRSGREREQLQKHPDPVYVDGYSLQQGRGPVRTVPAVDYSNRSGREREQLQRHTDPVYVDGHGLQQGRSPARIVAGREREQLQRHPASVSVDDYGLQQRSPVRTAPAVDYSSRSGREREQVQRHPVFTDDALPRREVAHPDYRVLSESEYQNYALRRPEFLTAMDPSHAMEDQNKETSDPYDASTTSLVNRYLSMPRTAGTDAGSSSMARRETFVNYPNYTSGTSGQPERVISNTGAFIIGNTSTLHPMYDYPARPPAVPDYAQRYRQLGKDPGLAPPTVASRYSFAGPSSSHR